MKKIIIVLVVIILGLGGFIGFKLATKKGNNNENVGEVAQEESYGKRGNISEEERVKFLMKNDDYLVGMMSLPASAEVKNFTHNEMINFALNVAVERYSTILTKSKKDSSSYVIGVETVNSILNEFFGLSTTVIDPAQNEYYSKSTKTFVYNQANEKTLYYYPVSLENKEGGIKEITVDAIYINDENKASNLDKAKFEGKYGQNNVDNTIKFIFNENGYLTSYQYL